MRPQIRKFIEACSRHISLPEPIVEIGAKRHPSQEKLANLRTLFPNRSFIGCDMEPGAGVDRIENLEKLNFKDGEVGTFILCDTLEHVQDLNKAMNELARCLKPDVGVVIATSVMLFPVHGFPNDYWRFTPEGFRDLARGFRWASTFFGGDPNLPHTVALLACRQTPNDGSHDRLVEAVKYLSPVPHYADLKSESMFSSLGAIILQQSRAAGREELPCEGDMGVLSTEGWVLSPGSWIKMAAPQNVNADLIELTVSGITLQTINRADWNCLISPSESGLHETAFQFDPVAGITNQAAQIEAHFVAHSGVRKLIARSRLGVILPQADLPRGLTLHSIDNRHLPDGVEIATAERAAALVHALRERGEKIVVDLGCGFRKAGNIGIDATPKNTDADLVCLLGFDPLPFEDGTVDEVVCRDFLEHIPKAVYMESKRQLHYPVMHLIDEVWRALKPGGIFRSWTPMYPHPEVFQDPTHLSAWTIKSMDYFCGVYTGAKRIYGIQACFEKIDVREEGFYLFAELRKPIAPDNEQRSE